MRYEIQLPDNKSIKIRRMVAVHVRGGEIPPVTDADGSDVRVVWRALQSLRAPSTSPVPIDVADCGAAYRFLMPILAATSGCWLLTGTPRLLQRPILPLVEVLRGIGAEIERVEDGWLIHGKPLPSAEALHATSLQRDKTGVDLSLTIDASQSSQMASALVLAAPLLGLRTLCLTTTDIPSLSYLRMTLALTRDWPVEIPGVEVPDIPVGAPGDWSAALFWFAHARLHPENEYLLTPLSLESIQGDSVIAQWFNGMNVSFSCENAYYGEDEAHCGDAKYCVSTPSCAGNIISPCIEIIAKPLGNTPRLVLDVRDNLDTVPVMAVLAALLPADITFQNVRNLRFKESDRLAALATQLAPYAEIELSDNVFRVKGKGEPVVARAGLDTCHDHRLAMAFLLFGPDAELNDVECLKKSYPGLLEQM